MKKFILLYLLNLCLLFTIFYSDISPLAELLNQWQIELTSKLTSLTLKETQMSANHIFIDNRFSLVIDKACNGFIPYLFLLASIIAFPSTLLHKIKWAIFGYLSLTLLNLLRIWFITQLVLHSKNNFSLAHDYIGNIFLVISGTALFFLFVKTRKIS